MLNPLTAWPWFNANKLIRCRNVDSIHIELLMSVRDDGASCLGTHPLPMPNHQQQTACCKLLLGNDSGPCYHLYILVPFSGSLVIVSPSLMVQCWTRRVAGLCSLSLVILCMQVSNEMGFPFLIQWLFPGLPRFSLWFPLTAQKRKCDEKRGRPGNVRVSDVRWTLWAVLRI